jgi:CheY-like chemotaxis protein
MKTTLVCAPDSEDQLAWQGIVRCDPASLASALSLNPELVLVEAGVLSNERLAEVAGEHRVVVLSGPSNVAAAAQAFRAGALDVWDPQQVTASSVDAAPTVAPGVARRFGSWAGRARISGILSVLPGTPLEGSAQFQDGVLKAALFCGLTGERALTEMLQMTDAEILFTPTATQQPTRQRLYAPRVGLVEDDQAIRTLLARVLEREGYQVFPAPDGVEGLALVQRHQLDLVLTDIDMPRLDGWGLLRYLKGDLRTREIPVVMLSAHEDMVMTLKAAQAGARAYLKKTGRSKELLDAVALLTFPRQRARVAAKARADFSVEVRAMGAAWLLELLAEFDAEGRLEIDDAAARYELAVREGRLVDVVAQSGSLRSSGPMALEGFLTCHGRGHFRRVPVERDDAAPFVSDSIERAARTLSLESAQRRDEVLGALKDIHVDSRLLRLYSQVATGTELKVLEALGKQPSSIEDLADKAGLEHKDVRRMVGELIRRGVLVE